MLSFGAGVTFNWSTTIVPILKSNDTSINPLPKPLSMLESSWIVAIVILGSVLGTFVGGVSIATLGKKKAILLLGIPVFTGHLIIAFATHVWMFLLARFAMGISLGSAFGVMASYTGDIAEDKNRGLIGAFTTVFMTLGGLIVYVTGPFMSIRLFSFLFLIPEILLFTLFGLFVPETPYDLLQKNSKEKATESLALYRGKNIIEIDDEFKKLQNILSSRNGTQSNQKPRTTDIIKTIFENRPLLQGVKIVGSVIILQSLSGMTAVASYYQTIFEESSGSLNSLYSVMIIGLVTLFSAVLNSQLVERLGRKFLLLTGFFFMGLSLFSLGTYFLLKSGGYDISPISWLPLAILIIYTIAYNIQGSIPWVLLTDIFPPNILQLCSTMTSTTMFSLNFILTLSFPYLTDALGNYGTFYMFGTFMACAVILVSIVVPETKGRSVLEVQEMLKKK